jgi:magnesium chelatase subunit I
MTSLAQLGANLPQTIGELRDSGYRVTSVREEMRSNLVAKMRAEEVVFPGIVGFEDTVIPQLENAILAGQDVILLGERGQAKSRIIRGLISLLDPYVPIIRDAEIPENPFGPISPQGRRLVAERGDEVEIAWLEREERYAEKLATPDVAVADLIGEVDPIKVAEGRYLSNEETVHYGLIPRTNRGIFAINELPDLTEKVQVGLFNLMEEKDVQIKGFKIRLPVDVMIVASANPEDYTSRGRIITPLKDRFDVQIRTHYPRSLDHEISIMEQEATIFPRGERAFQVPQFMKEILAQLTMEARNSSEINQASGVSVRVTINNFESLLSNAEKRAVRLGETDVVPRISDLHALYPSTAGKIELEYSGEEKKDGEIIERLISRAVQKVFDQHLSVEGLASVVDHFKNGWGVEISDGMAAEDYLESQQTITGLADGLKILGVDSQPSLIAAATEFILEGLHLHQKLNKESEGGRATYRA